MGVGVAVGQEAPQPVARPQMGSFHAFAANPFDTKTPGKERVVAALRGIPGVLRPEITREKYAELLWGEKTAAPGKEQAFIEELIAFIESEEVEEVLCTNELLRGPYGQSGLYRLGNDGRTEVWQRVCQPGEKLLVAKNSEGNLVVIASSLCLNPGGDMPEAPVVVVAPPPPPVEAPRKPLRRSPCVMDVQENIPNTMGDSYHSYGLLGGYGFSNSVTVTGRSGYCLRSDQLEGND